MPSTTNYTASPSSPRGYLAAGALIALALSMTNALGFNNVREMNQAIGDMGTGIECEAFDFNVQERQICAQVYKGCQRGELRPSERRKCVIDAVRSGKVPATKGAGSNPGTTGTPRSAGGNGQRLNFALPPAHALDLVEMCEQGQNKKRGICMETVLPNKSRITSDARSLGGSR